MGVGSTAVQTNGRATCPDCSIPGTLYNGGDGVMRCLSCHQARREAGKVPAAPVSRPVPGSASGLADPPKDPPKDQEQQPMATRQRQKVTDEQILEAVPKAANWKAAAKALGVSPKTLRERIEKLERDTGTKPLPLNGGRRGRGAPLGDTRRGKEGLWKKPADPSILREKVVPGRLAAAAPLEAEITEVQYLQASAEGNQLVVDKDGITIITEDGATIKLPLLGALTLQVLASMVGRVERQS